MVYLTEELVMLTLFTVMFRGSRNFYASLLDGDILYLGTNQGLFIKKFE